MAATRSLSTEIGIKPACDTLGIVRSGLYRGQGPAKEPSPRPSPPRACRPRSGRRSSRPCTPTASSTKPLPQSTPPCPMKAATTVPSEPCTASSMSRRRSGAQEPAPSPGLSEAGTPGDRPEPGLVVGHIEAPGPRDVVVLLPLCHAGYLQPVRGRLDDRHGGVGGAGPAAHLRTGRP